VLTNKPERHSRRVLDGLGLLARFETVIGGDTLPTRKPDPSGLRALAAGWGVPPADVLLVGDSDVDARTARAAGARLALVEWGFGDAATLVRPGDRRVSSPDDLVLLAGGDPEGVR
jgi:phosphoglycolate phosphatase